jgi:preprotein translocase subunit SecD
MRTLAVVLLIAFAIGGCHKKKEAPTTPRPKLELVMIDDAVDPFGAAGPMPTGVAILLEALPSSGTVHYARIVQQPGETQQAAATRLTSLLAPLTLPAGDRFAVGQDFRAGSFEPDALRSYVLTGPVVLTDANITDAAVSQDPDTHRYRVDVTFDPSGAKALESTTRSNIGKRLAIVVDDKVQSAPVIRSAIPGGHVQITMGRFDSVAAEKAEADRLAHGFTGK